MFLGMCPCSPYDRESPRESVSTLGSMSALPAWAGDSAPLGGTPGRERQTSPQTRLKVSQMSFWLLISHFLSRSVFQLPGNALNVKPDSNDSVSHRPGCTAGARLLWFDFTRVFSHNYICAKNSGNNAEFTRFIQPTFRTVARRLRESVSCSNEKTAQRPS